jgi:hypothetical protein
MWSSFWESLSVWYALENRLANRLFADLALQPHATSLDKPNDASAFIAVILAFLGIADITGASLTEEVALEYWLSNVPVRLLFLFGLTGYVYLFKDDGIFGSTSILRKTGPGDLIRNSLVFTWAFMETATWFWVSIGRDNIVISGMLSSDRSS